MHLRTVAVMPPLSVEVQQVRFAYGNSLVVLALVRHGPKELSKPAKDLRLGSQTTQTLFHFAKDETCKKEYPLEERTDSFGMLSPEEVILLLPRKVKARVVINLHKNTVRTIPHPFLSNPERLQLLVFPESDLFCIKESSSTRKGLYDEAGPRDIMLSYFKKSLPDKPFLIEKVHYDRPNGKEDLFHDRALQANPHSLLALFKRGQQQGQGYHIVLHGLQLEGKVYRPRRRHIHCPQMWEKSQEFVAVWEFREDQFMLVPPLLSEGFRIWILDYNSNGFRSFSCPFNSDLVFRVYFMKKFACIVEEDKNLLFQGQRQDTLHFVGYQSEKAEFSSKKQNLLRGQALFHPFSFGLFETIISPHHQKQYAVDSDQLFTAMVHRPTICDALMRSVRELITPFQQQEGLLQKATAIPIISFEVQQAAVAYDSSIVLLAHGRQPHQEWANLQAQLTSTVFHFGPDGQYKWEYLLEDMVFSFKMLDPQQVVLVADVCKRGTRVVINLRQKIVRKIPHESLNNQFSLKLFVFAESQLLCIKESSWSSASSYPSSGIEAIRIRAILNMSFVQLSTFKATQQKPFQKYILTPGLLVLLPILQAIKEPSQAVSYHLSLIGHNIYSRL